MVDKSPLHLTWRYRCGRIHPRGHVVLIGVFPTAPFPAPSVAGALPGSPCSVSIDRRVQEVLVDTLTAGAASSNTAGAAVASGVALATAVVASVVTNLLLAPPRLE